MSGTRHQIKQKFTSASAALDEEPLVKQAADKENIAPTASLGKRSRTEAKQQDLPRKKRTRDDLSIGINGWEKQAQLLRGL
jgi:hypothetical protein